MAYPRPKKDPHGILKGENRIQMFCYYNTLAWSILAAATAAASVFVALPFVVPMELGKQIPFFVFSEVLAFGLVVGGVYEVGQLRALGARWICLPRDVKSTSPRAWIDYVEAGNWETRFSPRLTETNKKLRYSEIGVFFGILALSVIWYFLIFIKP